MAWQRPCIAAITRHGKRATVVADEHRLRFVRCELDRPDRAVEAFDCSPGCPAIDSAEEAACASGRVDDVVSARRKRQIDDGTGDARTRRSTTKLLRRVSDTHLCWRKPRTARGGLSRGLNGNEILFSVKPTDQTLPRRPPIGALEEDPAGDDEDRSVVVIVRRGRDVEDVVVRRVRERRPAADQEHCGGDKQPDRARPSEAARDASRRSSCPESAQGPPRLPREANSAARRRCVQDLARSKGNYGGDREAANQAAGPVLNGERVTEIEPAFSAREPDQTGRGRTRAERNRRCTRDAAAGNSSGAVCAKADQIDHVTFGAESGSSHDLPGGTSHRLLELW